MKNIQFPLRFEFNVATLSNDFLVKDADHMPVAYARQKMFKFVDEVIIYTDEYKTNPIYSIKANKWIDFSATYTFYDNDGRDIGRVARKGWTSIWKARYEIFDAAQQLEYTIREDNPWIKVGDSVLRGIPLARIFAGYVFNPAYRVLDEEGKEVARLKKMPSFWGRKFTTLKLKALDPAAEERIVLALMMMILLERTRG